MTSLNAIVMTALSAIVTVSAARIVPVHRVVPGVKPKQEQVCHRSDLVGGDMSELVIEIRLKIIVRLGGP